MIDGVGQIYAGPDERPHDGDVDLNSPFTVQVDMFTPWKWFPSEDCTCHACKPPSNAKAPGKGAFGHDERRTM